MHLESFFDSQRAQILANGGGGSARRFEEVHAASAAAQRLDPNRARAGKGVDPDALLQRSWAGRGEHVEERLAQAVGSRTDVHAARRAQRPAPELTRDYPHVTFVCSLP